MWFSHWLSFQLLSPSLSRLQPLAFFQGHESVYVFSTLHMAPQITLSSYPYLPILNTYTTFISPLKLVSICKFLSISFLLPTLDYICPGKFPVLYIYHSVQRSVWHTTGIWRATCWTTGADSRCQRVHWGGCVEDKGVAMIHIPAGAPWTGHRSRAGASHSSLLG